MTIVAIFAGIVEVSGTGVLPFVSEANQRLYIWFLIVFPFFLVSIFFLTLNFNRNVLYAPSDWRDEDNFFRRFSRATADETLDKLRKEAEEDQTAQIETEIGNTQPILNQEEKTSRQPLPDSANRDSEIYQSYVEQVMKTELEKINRLRTLESKSLIKLGKELGVNFKTNVKYSAYNSSRVFDGVARDGNFIHIAEVKYFTTPKNVSNRIIDSLARTLSIIERNGHSNSRVLFHFIVVTPEDLSEEIRPTILSAMSESKLPLDNNVHFHFFKDSDL